MMKDNMIARQIVQRSLEEERLKQLEMPEKNSTSTSLLTETSKLEKRGQIPIRMAECGRCGVMKQVGVRCECGWHYNDGIGF